MLSLTVLGYFFWNLEKKIFPTSLFFFPIEKSPKKSPLSLGEFWGGYVKAGFYWVCIYCLRVHIYREGDVD